MEHHSTREAPHSLLRRIIAATGIIEEIDVGIIVYDRNGTVVDSNDTAAQLLGDIVESAQSVTGDEILTAIVKSDGTFFDLNEMPFMVAIREHRPVEGELMGVDSFARPRRWFRVSVTPVAVEGLLDGAVATYVDVTKLTEHSRMLELLATVNEFLTTARSEESLLQGLCDLLVNVGGYVLAWIGVASDESDGRMDYPFAAGEIDYLFSGIVSTVESSERGQGPSGISFRTRTVQVASDFQTQMRYEPWRERARRFHLASALAVPLDVSKVAVLTVYDRHTNGFDDSIVGGFVDIAQSVNLHVIILRSLLEARMALEQTLGVLATMVEKHDAYTEGHQFRVGELAEAIATDLGLDTELARLVRLSGGVHDLGKIGVPAEILARPGVLGPAEFEVVKFHAQYGYDILSSAGLPWPLPEVALQHHERMNGTGYPNGLAGDQIILPARIIAVADVVEAMTNHRPYRPALGIERALSEINHNKGTLYDPVVVDSCTALFEGGFGFEGTSVFLHKPTN